MTRLWRPWFNRASPEARATARRNLAGLLAALDRALVPGGPQPLALRVQDRMAGLARALEAALRELGE